MFTIGAIVDGTIAISWFLIAAGLDIPNILNGYTGAGTDYRLAMYISGMFMTGWTVLLAWGRLQPVERRGLLLITACLLLLSVIFEVFAFNNILGGSLFVFGVTKRLILSLLFTAAFYYSIKTEANILKKNPDKK